MNSCSVTKLCPTLCNSTDCSMPGFPVLHHLPEFAHTHIHWVCDAIQLSHPITPFSSCPQSFLALRSFLMSQLFASGVQHIGTSASVLPMAIQGWFSLASTGLISLLSKGLSRSPAPEFKSIDFPVFSLLYGPTLTSIHDSWKNHSFDYT